jgi:hypothetical protein
VLSHRDLALGSRGRGRLVHVGDIPLGTFQQGASSREPVLRPWQTFSRLVEPRLGRVKEATTGCRGPCEPFATPSGDDRYLRISAEGRGQRIATVDAQKKSAIAAPNSMFGGPNALPKIPKPTLVAGTGFRPRNAFLITGKAVNVGSRNAEGTGNGDRNGRNGVRLVSSLGLYAYTLRGLYPFYACSVYIYNIAATAVTASIS